MPACPRSSTTSAANPELMRVPGTHISSLLEISVIRVCRVEAVGYLVAVEEAVAVGVGVGWVGAVGEDFVVVA